MFIRICRDKKEEEDEIRIDFADDKLNSKDCIYSFFINWVLHGYARQKKDNPIKMCHFLIIYVW